MSTNMSFVVLSPADAIKLMDDFRSEKAFGIHWGTFQLTIEEFLAPKKDLEAGLKEKGKDPSSFVTTLIGETMTV